MRKYNSIAIIGPTASGKTNFAVQVAAKTQGEIISADSRQIYRGMDLGTGKDLSEYTLDGVQIPYHLIDIADAGYKYNVYEYQRDCIEAFDDIKSRSKLPLFCGGTGLYIESVLKGYKMLQVPPNNALQEKLASKSHEELIDYLKNISPVHNTTDFETKRRTIRAIEIAEYTLSHPDIETYFPDIKPLVIGLHIDRDLRREKISMRLKSRLEEGMVEEVQRLLASGVQAEDLIYYGLEYKFLTLYAIGKLSYEEMFSQLEIAIHQFAKRQMTWFRGMEKRGTKIHWINVTAPLENRISEVFDLFNSPV